MSTTSAGSPATAHPWSASLRLLSVNIGTETTIEGAGKSGRTGIFERGVEGPVAVTSLGLSGDTISDTDNHGVVDQAVYLYGAPDYAWWSEELGRELPPGTFGENLTFSGLRSAECCIGDRFLVGSAILEVTAPRIPCSTLRARMGDRMFVKRFMRAERPGFYCRVVRGGDVRAGDAVELERYEGENVLALELFRDFFDFKTSESALRLQLSVPIAVRARVHKERQLERLLARSGSSSRGVTVSES
jgi:MOSC domain-containing protein YiiM